MPGYSEAFKSRMIQRMAGRERISALALSRDIGVCHTTLSKWLRDARRLNGTGGIGMGEKERAAKSPRDGIPDTKLPGIGTNDSGVETVLGGNGSFHLASGEFFFHAPFINVAGIARGSSMTLTAIHRSYVADPGTGNADQDPTGGELPFGAGWLPTFAEGLLSGGIEVRARAEITSQF